MNRKLILSVLLLFGFAASAETVLEIGTGDQVLRKRLKGINFKKIEFDDTDYKTVMKYLKNKTKEIDEEGKSFNIFWKCKKETKKKLISLDMNDLPLTAIFYYISLATNTDIKIEEHAIIIMDRDPKVKAIKYQLLKYGDQAR